VEVSEVSEMQTDRTTHKHQYLSNLHHLATGAHLPCCRYVSAMLSLCCVNLAGCCDRSGLSPVIA